MTNPFMVTSNQCYGMSFVDQQKELVFMIQKLEKEQCRHEDEHDSNHHLNDQEEESMTTTTTTTNTKSNNTESHHNVNSSPSSYDLSFLYSRESDRIGEGIEYSDSELAKVLTKKTSLAEDKHLMYHKKRSTSSSLSPNPILSNHQTFNEINNINNADRELLLEQHLKSYVHETKEENPLYVTSSNEYGCKKPCSLTYTAVRNARGQSFSNSFHRNMFKDQGLNTSMTRSRVHQSLDPQFI